MTYIFNVEDSVYQPTVLCTNPKPSSVFYYLCNSIPHLYDMGFDDNLHTTQHYGYESEN